MQRDKQNHSVDIGHRHGPAYKVLTMQLLYIACHDLLKCTLLSGLMPNDPKEDQHDSDQTLPCEFHDMCMYSHHPVTSMLRAYTGEVAPSFWQAPLQLVAGHPQLLQLQHHLVMLQNRGMAFTYAYLRHKSKSSSTCLCHAAPGLWQGACDNV